MDKILFGVPEKNHRKLACDEIEGLQNIGFKCYNTIYGGNEGKKSPTDRICVLISNIFKIINLCYKYKPNKLYLNSRFDKIGCSRDFISLIIFKILYFPKIEIIVKTHGSDLEILNFRSNLFNKLILNILDEMIDKWLFLSIEEYNFVIEKSFSKPTKIFVTKNIIDNSSEVYNLEESTVRDLYQLNNYDVLLFFIGRIAYEKGIFDVINGFENANLSDKYKLFIIGNGPQLDEVMATCAEMRSFSNIIFTGFIEEKQTLKFYTECDILIFPTYFSEGFSMSLFRSVCYGKGIITTKIRAAKDFLVEPQNCLWVEPKNSGAVSLGIKKLVSEKQLLLEMKENNRKMASLFSRDTICQEIKSILDK